MEQHLLAAAESCDRAAGGGGPTGRHAGVLATLLRQLAADAHRAAGRVEIDAWATLTARTRTSYELTATSATVLFETGVFGDPAVAVRLLDPEVTLDRVLALLHRARLDHLAEPAGTGPEGGA